MAGLFLVALQLSLPGFAELLSRDTSSPGDAEKENRTWQQWLKAVRGYLYWRAGEDWRAASDRANPARWEYLDAARLITDILSSTRHVSLAESIRTKKAGHAQAELDIMRGAPIPLTLEESRLTNQPRPMLVAELMRDPLYTDARLLNRLAKRKLARMVVQSRQRRAAMAEMAAMERRSA